MSTSTARYQKLGVPLLNHFTQHGTLINRLIRRAYPQYRRVRSRAALLGFRRTTYYQEQFHLVMFMFFGLVSMYAAVRGYLGWTVLLIFINILYNVYPMWLQQYLRLRLAGALNVDE